MKSPLNSYVKVYFSSINNKTQIINNELLLMKSSGRECILAFTKKINSTFCFIIYNAPKIKFNEINPIKLESNNSKQLNLDNYDYPNENIKYISNHPDIIKVNNKGNITAIRPGSAIITASSLDNIKAYIKVLSISNNGFINNYTLDLKNASHYDNVMIVSHPDDETLWGGANLFKDSYFIVCLTNAYDSARASDFKEIVKYTKNSGIILNYPDMQDNIRDNWSEVEEGLIKDLSKIVNYKNWKKIVTHGPDGTTGHLHHKKTCEYVTNISKKYNKFNNLYYFGKFYRNNSMPKYLIKMSDKDLERKKTLVEIYKSVKSNIHKIWYHMLPYENWILASNWKNSLNNIKN